jgi:type I restriction enzyme S subunit
MTGRYQAYPEYKDSDVECLGKLPIHWTLQSLSIATKRISVGLATSVTEYYRDDGVPIIRNMNIKEGYFDDSDMLFLDVKFADSQSNKSVFSGDVIVVHTGSNVGLACIVPEKYDKCHTFTTLIVTTSDILLNTFLTYCINSSYGKAEVNRLKFGFGKDNLNVKEFKCFYTIIPEYIEQVKICNFLDHETAKIDTLIEKQQQLIQLLKEKRQAVISHAVTKGLNPDVPMRDSGVEWLGEVPEHWTITRAKFLFDFVTSGSRGWAEYYSDDGALFFRITNLTRDTIEPKLESIQNVTPPRGCEGERSKISKNDLLISITADLGSVCVANEEVSGGYVSQHVSLCRPNGNVASARWLGFYFLSDIAKEQFNGSGYGGTKIQLSLEDIRELWVVKPRDEEQIKIAEYIERQIKYFEKLVLCSEAQIKLLQERRTALISAAVTGKIDVRNWQTPKTNTSEAA